MDDLSSLAPGLSGGSSMAGGNTVTDPGPFQAAGSPSESSADIPAHDTPELDLGPVADMAHLVPGDGAHDGYGWPYAEGLHP